ncbi:hypothetical protein [Sulfitobacter sabulilitoris]|uniref:hypothetical protein n=1 Tax=Sulfitobacter sabulilitoris TaxID=2562655 RepID=UPI001478D181|nr:hypothetical protein [Sulfitobacter sabulilitoris]
MKPLLAALGLMTLAACGADGEPVRPTANGTVTISSSGVHAGVGVGLHKGPFSVFLGL